ncbi:MAG: carbon starvation protein A [Nitrospirae bacterium]|nr:carbon starvation protein A [Nitrospirota bacterium]
MKFLKLLVFSGISILGAFSLLVVTRVINPGETVNALWLVVAAACVFIIAYRFYGSFLAAKVMSLDDSRETPVTTMADGRDYHPTNRWVLLGHHFAAIAGAGPLIGPVLAAQFGYLPGTLWILIGAVFAGAVHDFVILVASMRRGGRSLARIARDEVGPITGLASAIAVLFIIIIALAGLGLAVVNALTHSPWGTYTIFMTIPIALLMGVYMHSVRPGRVSEVTVIGVTLLILAVVTGHYIPGSWAAPMFDHGKGTLVLSLAVYGFLASVLPVWLLLAPRDYLSTYMKVGTVAILAAGVIFLAPEIHMPAVTQFVDGGGPVIPGKVFPFMFITIACGAISGFHSLISSGTTPKMITRETDAKMIGYGSMLIEGFVGIVALVAATILIPGDYLAINSMLTPSELAAIGFPVSRLAELSAMVGVDVANRPGGAVSLAVGMASIFSALPGMKALMSYWYNFALMFEALFILTTIDAGTRVARFLVQEFAGHAYRPLGRIDWMPGIVGASALVVAAWGLLIYGGSVSTIWPMFGVANQLLAGIALSVGTTVLIRSGRARYAWVTVVPLAFIAVTTFTAAHLLFYGFLDKAAADPARAFTFRLNAGLVGLMAGLSLVVLLDSAYKWYVYLGSGVWRSPSTSAADDDVIDVPAWEE